MFVGIHSRTYETGNLEETFRRMVQDGIHHTQFNLSNAGLPSLPKQIAPAELERIAQTADHYGVTLDAISGTFNMIDPDEDARSAGIAQFRLQCQISHALQIPIVSLCTGSKNPKDKWTWHEDNRTEQAWTDLLRTTEVLLRYAEESQVVLGVEVEAANVVDTPARGRAYLDTFQSPHLKIIMDGANLLRPEWAADQERVLTEAFELLGRDIVFAHAKDFRCDGGMHFVPAGQGSLNYPLYLSLLRQYGYDGCLDMHGLPADQVGESRAFLEGML